MIKPNNYKAGLFSKIWTKAFPKSLQLELTTEALETGEVEISPKYFIGSREIDLSKIDFSKPLSKIDGYFVKLKPNAISLHEELAGKTIKLSRRKAGEYLRNSALKIKSKKGAAVAPEQLQYEVDLKLNDDEELEVVTALVTKKGIVIEKPVEVTEVVENDGWFALDDQLFKLPSVESELTSTLLSKEKTILKDEEVPKFLWAAQDLPGETLELNKDTKLSNLEITSTPPEPRVEIAGDEKEIQITPKFVYRNKLGQEEGSIELPRGKEFGASNDEANFKRSKNGWIRRNVAEEHRLVKLGSWIPIVGDAKGNVTDTLIPKVIVNLTDKKIDRSPWNVYVSEAVSKAHKVVDEKSTLSFKIKVLEQNGRSILQLDPSYNHGRFKASHDQMSKTLASGKEWVRKDNAWIKLDHPQYQKVQNMAVDNGLTQSGAGFVVPALERDRFLNLFSRLGTIEHEESYAQFVNQLADFQKIEEVPLPRSLNISIGLREYQRHGLNWLDFLRRYNLNGVLADDMGLGKTLQTLSVVRLDQERRGDTAGPSLIICPTSVVQNWSREAHKFFRGFNTVIYNGSNRDSRLRSLGANTLVITSYGVATNDSLKLKDVQWHYLIIDEAHNLKNPSAQRTKAIKIIPSEHRLTLTGTPIQNRPEELWSLFDLLMPGYLGNRTEFNRQYKELGNLTGAGFGQLAVGLKKRVDPFVMRRLKKDVAKDLPDKFVIEYPVELTPTQVQMYKGLTSSAEFAKVEEKLNKDGVKRSQIEILALLGKLRDICNHPHLVSPTVSPIASESGKLSALCDLMMEIKEGTHRALLFCQSTRMLDIIQSHMGTWGYKILRLDGTTNPNERQRLVDRFNNDSTFDCFLISTKAGGTGLNLVGADTVIFYDHDWNPANDDQAQDRAYRIGQKKNVSVYKLISTGTIEDHILARQRSKKMIADAVIGVESEGFKNITKEELLALFKYNPKNLSDTQLNAAEVRSSQASVRSAVANLP